MYYKLNEEMINRKYTIKLCSIEKKYIYYRNNFKRVCIENNQLKNEIYNLEKIIEMMAEDLTTDYHSKEWFINYYKNKEGK